MSDFILTLEVAAGASISSVSKEAVSISQRLQIRVRFYFNGVLLYSHPNISPLDIEKRYHDELKKAID